MSDVDVPEAIKGTWLEEAARRADEPLDPELERYLIEGDDGLSFTMLKHPLVFEIPFVPMLAYRANDFLKYKQKAVRKAMREHNWSQVIWLHERAFRWQALRGIRRKVGHRQYWELLGMVWVDSENIWQNLDIVPGMLTAQRPGRRYIMSPEEQAALAAMPAVLTVYRGYTDPRGTRLGWSWTLDRDKAAWFAKRLASSDEEPVVVTGTVSRDKVIAYFTGRGESEIVTDPKEVHEEARESRYVWQPGDITPVKPVGLSDEIPG